MPLCGALQLAHERGVLHRDLKPANIVAHDFGGGTRIHKIVDFGLARRARIDGGDAAHRRPSVPRDDRLRGAGAAERRRPRRAVGHLQPRRRHLRNADRASAVRRGGPDDGVERRDVEAGAARRAACARICRRGWTSSSVARWRSLRRIATTRWLISPSHLRAGGGADRSTMILDAPAGRRRAGCSATYESAIDSGRGAWAARCSCGTHRAMGHPVAIRLLRREASATGMRSAGRFSARSADAADRASLRSFTSVTTARKVIWSTSSPTTSRAAACVRCCRRTGRCRGRACSPLLRAAHRSGARPAPSQGGLLCGMSPDIMRVRRTMTAERLMISTAGIWQAQDLLATLHERRRCAAPGSRTSSCTTSRPRS